MDGFVRDPSARSKSFYSTGLAGVISRSELDFLEREAVSDGAAARVCLHRNAEEHLHSMVVAQVAQRYWRPKKHLTKSKILQIVRGRMAVVTFTDSGVPLDLQILDPGGLVVVRIPAGVFHTNAALTEVTAHHEIIEGPYAHDEPDRVLAPFAPPDEDEEAGLDYMQEVMGMLELGVHATPQLPSSRGVQFSGE